MSPESDSGQTEVWSHACSACGSCCNSAPPLSLPELFYHQSRFIGGLALRRIRRQGGGSSEVAQLGPDLCPRMSDELLERCLTEAIAAQDVEDIQFTWHGWSWRRVHATCHSQVPSTCRGETR
jgi:hypothetical protein